MSLWRWADRIAPVPEGFRVTLGEGRTPLVKSRRVGPAVGLRRLYFKLESSNPTGSYKDRFAAVAVSHALATGVREVVATSSGNAGAALAAYCAAAGLAMGVTTVESAPLDKVAQMLAYGATVARVAGFGRVPEVDRRVLAELRRRGREPGRAFLISAFRDCPEGMSGLKTLAYELDEELPGGIDHVFCCAGSGGLALGVALGFADLPRDRRARVECVQPEGNATVAGPLSRGESHAVAVTCTTAISGVQVPTVIDGQAALEAVRASGGTGRLVADADTFAAQRRLAEEEGDLRRAGRSAAARRGAARRGAGPARPRRGRRLPGDRRRVQRRRGARPLDRRPPRRDAVARGLGEGVRVTTTPTRVRYGMVLATTFVAVMLYLDRVCLSIVGEQIRGDQKLTDDQYSVLLSAFFWAYALFQLPAGWLGDRFGPRRVLTAYLFLWSACTGLIGVVSGFAALLALRLGCGLFEAGAYPLAAGVVSRWVPAAARGRASSAVAVGGQFGAAVAPTLTLGLAVAAGVADGWRRPFLLYGVVGMAGAVAYYFWFRDRPAEHPAVNAAEAELIAGGVPTPTPPPAGPPPLREFVASRALWLNSFVQFAGNFGWVFIITLLPSYLEKVFDTSRGDQAFYQSLTLYVGIAGMLLGGLLTDFATRQLGPRWGRAVPMAASRVVVGLAYVACLWADTAVALTGLMCVVSWATYVGTSPTWAWAQDVGGRHVGAVVGWANMWGNFGAAAVPLVFQSLMSRYPGDPAAGGQVAFLLCAALQAVAAVAALGVSAANPIVAAPPRDGSGTPA